MIIYFANRSMEIQGSASTGLPGGFTIVEDNKTEEIETGVAVFECRVKFNSENRLRLEAMCEAGNYLLRSDGDQGTAQTPEYSANPGTPAQGAN